MLFIVPPYNRAVVSSSQRGACPLRRLDVRSNVLGAEGTALIANALAVNTTLDTLQLADNDIGPCTGMLDLLSH